MPRLSLDERPELPQPQRRSVEIVGYLIEQPTARYASARGEPIASILIEAEKQRIPVLVFGEAAKRAAETPAKSGVHVAGTVHCFVAASTRRPQLRIEASVFQVLAKPVRRTFV